MSLNKKTKQRVTIRKGVLDDVEQMFDLAKQSLQHEKDYRQKFLWGCKTLIAQESNGVVFVALYDNDNKNKNNNNNDNNNNNNGGNNNNNNKLIGMIMLLRQISTVQGTYVGIVKDFIVDANYRSQGIGQLLMEECEKYAVKNNWTRLAPLVDDDNDRAQKFKQRNGFERSQMVLFRKFYNL